MPTKLTYVSEDRSQHIEVLDEHDGPVPRWIPYEGGAAHLISSTRVSTGPANGDLIFVPLATQDIEVLSYVKAERWWLDGIAPWIQDVVEANRMKEQYESFEDMRSHIERTLEVEASAGGKILKHYGDG